MNTFEKEIRRRMDAGFPILYIQTYEAEKAKRAVINATEGLRRLELPAWDGTDRVCDLRSGRPLYQGEEAGRLDQILDDRMSLDAWEWDSTLADHAACQAVVLENVPQFKDDPAVIARLKKFAELIHSGRLNATVFILSPLPLNEWIAPELEKYIVVLEMEDPSEDEIREIIQDFCAQEHLRLSDALAEEFITAFKGMSGLEIEHTLQLLATEAGELNRGHVGRIFQQKCQILKKTGILELISPEEDISAIGGLQILKQWLQRKARTLSRWMEAKEFGVDMPKGVLIAGIPGCGKSMIAKASANLFQIPLVRLEMGRLLGKYQGESEGNMLRATKLAEKMAPCVLWIDELEKAFAGTGGDDAGGEVATRLLGSFLTWLQEKRSAVFVVATANDVGRLPSELLRKGRLDENFYVDLPKLAERREIFAYHIEKRRRRAGDLRKTGKDGKLLIDLDRLARESEGYSGADIEGIVRESVEKAFCEGRDALTTQDLLDELKQTQSQSEMMGDSLKQLREFYEGKRFKNASAEGGK